MPPGGDGYYYFSVYLNADGAETAVFDAELNGELVCTAYSDLTESIATDLEATSCSGVTEVSEGMYNRGFPNSEATQSWYFCQLLLSLYFHC